MLRDRYTPVDLLALVPALGLAFEPVLARLDVLLDDDVLFRAVRDDLARWRPHTRETGRPSTPVEVLLRLLIVKRLYGWSYAETERFVGNLVGTYNDLAELMTLAARGKVTLHTQTYPLEAANDAIHDLDQGRLRGRGILIPSGR